MYAVMIRDHDADVVYRSRHRCDCPIDAIVRAVHKAYGKRRSFHGMKHDGGWYGQIVDPVRDQTCTNCVISRVWIEADKE